MNNSEGGNQFALNVFEMINLLGTALFNYDQNQLWEEFLLELWEKFLIMQVFDLYYFQRFKNNNLI